MYRPLAKTKANYSKTCRPLMQFKRRQLHILPLVDRELGNHPISLKTSISHRLFKREKSLTFTPWG